MVDTLLLFFSLLFLAVAPLSIAGINISMSLCLILSTIKFIRGKPWHGKIEIDYTPILFLLFFLWAFIAGAVSSNPARGIHGVLDLWAFLAYFAGRGASGIIHSHEGIAKRFLFGSAMIASLFAAIQFLIGTDFQHQTLGSRNFPAFFPAIGFFTHHLTFAGVISFIFIISLSFFAEKMKIGRGLVSFIMGIGLFASLSRGYFISTAIASFFIFKEKSKKAAFLWLLCIAISVVVMVVIFPHSLGKKVKSVTDMNATTNAERIYLWRSGIDMIMNRPLAGYGIGNYLHEREPYIKKYASRIISPSGAGFTTKCHCHNLYLQIFIDTGIIGLIIFCLLIFSALRDVRKASIIRDPLDIGVFWGAINILIAGLIEFNLGDAEVASLFFFLIGAIRPFKP